MDADGWAGAVTISAGVASTNVGAVADSEDCGSGWATGAPAAGFGSAGGTDTALSTGALRCGAWTAGV